VNNLITLGSFGAVRLGAVRLDAARPYTFTCW